VFVVSRFAIAIVVLAFRTSFSHLVLFEPIDPAIEFALALDFDQITVAIGLDDVRTAGTVGIEGGLRLAMRDCVFPKNRSSAPQR